MRILKEIPHPQLKITIFSWNGKYLLKIEAGQCEQTYKISELDLTSEDDLLKLADEPFIEQVIEIFKRMHQQLHTSLSKL